MRFVGSSTPQIHRKLECQAALGGQNARTFPTDESALKLLFLVLNLVAKEWMEHGQRLSSPSCSKTALPWRDENGLYTEI
jgi:hypothetical protein